MSQRVPDRVTALSSLLSSTHGRDRREERNIEKIDLQRARRYGMKEAGHNGRHKFTYGGIVFIYDPLRKREVTTFAAPDISLGTSGTEVAQPVMLDKKVQYECLTEKLQHHVKQAEMEKKLGEWTSHSVLVIDMSGSMRRDDVNGARCRSDGVWMVLARDYVKRELDKKSRDCKDLISVVVMSDEARCVIRAEPTDWVLYNKLVDLREWSNIRPRGPGNYMPALDLAEQLLLCNTEGSCALSSLLFFSDGRPSDRGDFAARMGKIASRFGRRLSITCVGMAEEGEDFSTLHQMVNEAKAYGAVASFGKPSLDADALSNIITSLASSLTTSKTEMTELATGKGETVRMDVRRFLSSPLPPALLPSSPLLSPSLTQPPQISFWDRLTMVCLLPLLLLPPLREKVGTPDDAFLTDEWYIYRHESVGSFWDWSYEKDDFVEIVETRCMGCWAFVAPARRIYTCPACKVATYCSQECMSRSKQPEDHGGVLVCSKFRSKLQSGMMATKDERSLPSWSVAMRKTVFGEGAERMVHKFRFLDDKTQNFIGPKMVAKESRFVDLETSYQHRMDYHREFMRTQAIASKMAAKFNETLDSLSSHFPAWDKSFLDRLPRIMFLAPLLVEVMHQGAPFCTLIEPMLDVAKYEKFQQQHGLCQGPKESRQRPLVRHAQPQRG